MIKMQLLYPDIIRTLLYGGGFIAAIYVLFDFRLSKKTLIDVILGLGVYYLTNLDNNFLVFKELLYVAVAVVIITVNHKEELYSAFLFSGVSFYMLVLVYPIAMGLFVSNDKIINAITTQSNDEHAYLSVFVGGILVLVFYVLGALILKRLIDVRHERLKTIYRTYGLLNLGMILMLSIFLNYVVNDLAVGLSLKNTYFIMGFGFFGLIYYPFIGFYVIHKMYLRDIDSETLEKELFELMDSRLLAYRYNHNLNSIILTCNLLAKKKDKKEILAYLDKKSINKQKM